MTPNRTGMHQQVRRPTRLQQHRRLVVSQRFGFWARRIGETYAARGGKSSTPKPTTTSCPGLTVKADLPDDLRLALLLFAEHNGLADPDQLDQHLRCGF